MSEHEKKVTEKENVSKLVCFSDFSENSEVGRQCDGHISFSCSPAVLSQHVWSLGILGLVLRDYKQLIVA